MLFSWMAARMPLRLNYFEVVTSMSYVEHFPRRLPRPRRLRCLCPPDVRRILVQTGRAKYRNAFIVFSREKMSQSFSFLP